MRDLNLLAGVICMEKVALHWPEILQDIILHSGWWLWIRRWIRWEMVDMVVKYGVR